MIMAGFRKRHFIDDKPPGFPVACVLPVIGEDCWLKLDVEGAEHEVLPALFAKGYFPRWISTEIHFFDKKGKNILSLLRGCGYNIRGGKDPLAQCAVISASRCCGAAKGTERRRVDKNNKMWFTI